MKKILVGSWLAGGIFSGTSAGGSEYRSFLLFNEISKLKRYNISFFVKGTKKSKKIRRMNIVFCSSNFIKITKKFTELLKRQDIYCGFAMNRLSPLFYLLAKINNKQTVYFLTHDADVGVGLENVPKYYPLITNIVFPLVDVFVTQSDFQYKLLKKKYNHKKIFLLKNPINIKPTSNKVGKSILWVGRNDKTKGIDVLRQIIQDNPEKKFKIIGLTKKDLDLNLPNIDILGRINQKEMFKYYKEAKFVISTSKVEGFSNVFLQAFASKKPIISYKVNPDNFLDKSNGGVCAFGDYNLFRREIDKLYISEKKIREMGNNGFNYIRKEHDLKKISKQLAKILDKL